MIECDFTSGPWKDFAKESPSPGDIIMLRWKGHMLVKDTYFADSDGNIREFQIGSGYPIIFRDLPNTIHSLSHWLKVGTIVKLHGLEIAGKERMG